MRHDDQAIDPGTRHEARAARQDGLAGEADELLGDLAPESIAGAGRQEQCVDPHRASWMG
jgi:hypothetical protein